MLQIQNIVNNIGDIETELANALAAGIDQASIDSIRESLRDALVCKRLADNIQLGKWDLV